jgi:hypothetical protein
VKIFFFVLFSGCIFFSSLLSCEGADFHFSSAPNIVKNHDTFKIDFVVEANFSPLNALAGKINYTDEIIKLESIELGNSSLDFWVEKPAITKHGEINFSGIIPNGFSDKITLFSAIFSVYSTGTINFSYHDLQALLNDGQGTPDIISRQKHLLLCSRGDFG